MYMNYRLGSGQQFKTHPALQPAWQEIVDIFHDLDILARITSLKVKQVKTIPLSKEEREVIQDPSDIYYGYCSFANGTHTIRVKRPNDLACVVADYIDHVYACAKAMVKEEPHMLTDDPDVEKNMHMLVQIGMKNASEFWKKVNPLEKAMYENDKYNTFGMVFEAGIAALVYRNGRVPLSCPDHFWFLDPGRVDQNQKTISIHNPFCAFALDWSQFEGWWYDMVKTALNESILKIRRSPFEISGRIFANDDILYQDELYERLIALKRKADKPI